MPTSIRISSPSDKLDVMNLPRAEIRNATMTLENSTYCSTLIRRTHNVRLVSMHYALHVAWVILADFQLGHSSDAEALTMRPFALSVFYFHVSTPWQVPFHAQVRICFAGDQAAHAVHDMLASACLVAFRRASGPSPP